MAKTHKTGYHHGDLRAALLRAGMSLLEEEGAAKLSLREVARRAGVSHAAPYRHFKDKGALLEAIAAEGFRQLKTCVDAVVERHRDDSEAQLVEVGAAYVQEAVRHPQRIHLMFGGTLARRDRRSQELRDAGEASFGSFVGIVRRAEEAGILRPAPTREVVLALWSSVHGLAMLVIAGQLRLLEVGDDPETLGRIVSAKLLGGLLQERGASAGQPGSFTGPRQAEAEREPTVKPSTRSSVSGKDEYPNGSERRL